MYRKLPTPAEWLVMRKHPYHKIGLEANFGGQKYKEPHLPLERMGELRLDELLDKLRPCTGTEYHFLSCGLLISTPGHVEPCGQTCFWNNNPTQSPAPFFCAPCRSKLVKKFSLFFPCMRFHDRLKEAPAWKTHPLREKFYSRWDFLDARRQCITYDNELRSKLRFPPRVLEYEDLVSEIKSRENEGEVEMDGSAHETPDPYGHLNFETLPNKRTMEHWATQQMLMEQLPKPCYEGHRYAKVQGSLQQQQRIRFPSAVSMKGRPRLLFHRLLS
jgi:hypothetical protein